MAKRPRDPNQRAKLIVDIATGEAEDSAANMKNPKRRGFAGGLKGGKARSKILTPEERKQIAKIAARARWNKN